jgi:hypothetical protein
MGDSKFIAYSSILGVCYQPERQVKGTSKCLGIGNKPVWWANDRGAAKGPSQFCVAVDCGELSWKGFSVERVQDFLYAFTPLLPKVGTKCMAAMERKCSALPQENILIV